MELRDFIKESLVQIIQGVSDAQHQIQAATSQGAISPRIRNDWSTLDKKGVLYNQDGCPLQTVEFDVAVTATEGTGTKGGIGIAVGFLGLGSQGQSSASRENISRIKFAVPISLPTHPTR